MDRGYNRTNIEEGTRQSGARKFSFRRLVEELMNSHRKKQLPKKSGSPFLGDINLPGNLSTLSTSGQGLIPFRDHVTTGHLDQSYVVALLCVAVIGFAFVFLVAVALAALWYVKRNRNADPSTTADRQNRSSSQKFRGRFKSRGGRKGKKKPIATVYTVNGLTNQVFEMSPSSSSKVEAGPATWARNYGVKTSLKQLPPTKNQLIKMPITPPEPIGNQLMLKAAPQQPLEAGTGSRSLVYSSGIGSSAFDSTLRYPPSLCTGSTSGGGGHCRGNKKRKSLMEALEDLASGDISAMSGYKLPFPLQQPPTPMADSDCEEDLESGIVNGYSPNSLNRSFDPTSPRHLPDNSSLYNNQRIATNTPPRSGLRLGPPPWSVDRREVIVDPGRFYRRSSSRNSLTLPAIPEIHLNSEGVMHPPLATPRVFLVGTVRSLGRPFSRRPLNQNVLTRDLPVQQLTPLASIPPPTSSSPTEGDVDEEWRRVVKEIQDLGSTNEK